jgi:AcrR family transcriptional regulator
MDRARQHVDRAQERVERAGERVEGRKERDRPMIWLREEPRARRPAYSRDKIAAAAVEIADAEGFEAVSMRRVAQALGSGTMTLYHYVLNKDELITLMVDAVMGEVLVPADELAASWRPALAQIAKRSREAFRRHRWTLDTLGDGRSGPNGIRHFEQSLQAVSSAPVSNEAKFELIGMVDDYVFGFALREAQEFTEHQRGFPADVREFLQRELDSGEYPLVRQVLGTDVDAGIDRVAEILFREGRFERGLERLLDGIEAEMERS